MGLCHQIQAASFPCCCPVASLSPPCRFFGTFGLLLLPCGLPVASLSLSCRSPVAALLLPCRFPAAFVSLFCRFLLLPVVSCRYAVFCLGPSCCSPAALLSFLPVAVLSLFPVASWSPSCRLPVVFLLLPYRLPVTSLLIPWCTTWYPVALPLLAWRLPEASLLPACRLPVISLPANVLPCRSPVAFLWLACRFPVRCLSPTCRFPVAFLSSACRLFSAFWSEPAWRKIPCRTPRRGGRCAGGGRPGTRGRGGGARDRSTVGTGGPEDPGCGRGRGARSLC